MHKYQATSATVLPIATDNIAGETEEASIAPDRVGSGKPLKAVVGERIVLPRVTSNSQNVGVAFTPHAQQLQPIDGGHGQEPKALANQEADATTTAHAATYSQAVISAASSTPAPEVTAETSTECKQPAAPQQEESKKSAIPVRRMTVEVGGDKKPQRVQRKRSMSLQPTKEIGLTKNYEQLVREFNMLRPFTRCPDGTYPRDTKCVICRRARPTSVFFPCQHRCVCDDCVASHRISADRSVPSNWCACPVCMADICLILAHSGKEEEKYWKWVMEVQPRLSTQFKTEFKETARRLEKGTTTASASFEHESEPTNRHNSGKLAPRHHTWQQPNAPTSGRRARRGDSGRSTCSIL